MSFGPPLVVPWYQRNRVWLWFHQRAVRRRFFSRRFPRIKNVNGKPMLDEIVGISPFQLTNSSRIISFTVVRRMGRLESLWAAIQEICL